MGIDLARIQVEVLEPGAVIVGNGNIAMYINPPRPFISWPDKPTYGLDKGFDSIVVKEMTARIHIQTLGTGMDLITLGDLDFLLTLHPERKLFGPWLGMFVAMAVKAERPVKGYRKHCRIAAFDVDVKQEKIRFAGWLPEGDKLRKLLEAK
jgi:hypothetical protein